MSIEDGALQTEWPDRPAGPPPPRRSPLRFLRELPVLIAIAFGLALLIKTFLIQAFYIPSESMVPTLLRGDRVLVNKLVYRFREPRRGEVIVFVARHGEERGLVGRIIGFLTEGLGATRPSEEDFIKRIIGLPGETVEMRDGVVTVTRPDGTGLALREPYLVSQPDLRPFGPFLVPAGTLFVMGDNRPASGDSRFDLGPVKRSDVIGKAFVKVWPPSRAGVLSVPEYGGTPAAGIPETVGAPALLGALLLRRRRARPAAAALSSAEREAG